MSDARQEALRKINGINIPFHCLIEDQSKKMDPRFLPDGDPNKADWPFHYHKYVELIYILEGNVKAFINNEIFTLHPDDMLVVFPFESHRFTSVDSSGFKYGVMKFFPEIINAADGQNSFEYIYNLNGACHTRLFHSFNVVKDAFINSAEAFSRQDYGFDILVPGYIMQVCFSLVNKWHSAGEIQKLDISEQNISVFYDLINLIRERQGKMTSSEAANFCHFSYGYFARKFKSIFGMDYKHYIRRIKINEAKRLLLCTDNTVTQIGSELGYSSTSHFITDFKKETNISPKHYRTSGVL